MAISPNAPDYVSQVRGIINDLRQDYISQMQLYQTEMNQRAQSQAEMNRSLVQMQAQNAQNQLARKQIDDNRFVNEQKIASDRQQHENEMGLKYTQEYAKAELERQNQDKENMASALEQEFRVAEASGDQNQINRVMDKIGKASLASAQRTQIYNNVFNTLDKMKEWEQTTNNIKTSSIAKNMLNDLSNLDPSKLTPDDYMAKANLLTQKFNSLNNNDPVILDSFFKTKNMAASRLEDYKKSRIGEQVTNFINLAEREDGSLPVALQEKYNQLKGNPQKYSPEAIQGLAFQFNRDSSVNALKNFDQTNVRLLEQVSKNPQMAGRDFSGILPDLSPSVSPNGNIDPDTGLLTKQFLDRQKVFEDDIRRPSFMLGQDLTMQQAMARNMPPINFGNTGVAPQKSAKAGQETAKNDQTVSGQQVALAPKIQSVSRFDSTEPGAATIPVASKTPATKISDSTIQSIAETYKKDPNAVVYGRPVREIIAAMKSRGYAIPSFQQATSIVSPGAVEDAGQNR